MSKLEKGKPKPHSFRWGMNVSNGIERGTMRAISIPFDPDVFREIQSRAHTNGISFSAQVRLLINQALTQS